MIPRMKTKKPKPKVLINVGCLFDIPTATFITGPKGETIINGGLQMLNGVVGPPNSYKSAISDYFALAALDTMLFTTRETMFSIYDSEINTDFLRIVMLSSRLPNINEDILDEEDGNIMLTDASMHSGDEYYTEFKSFTKELQKRKKVKYESRIDFEDYVPTFNLLDSLSKIDSSANELRVEKNTKDDGSLNTLDMNKGKFRAQIVADLPRRCSRANNYFITTAHVGESIDMDTGPMAKFNKPVKKLQYLGDKDKLKGVPPDFSTLMSIVWFLKKAKPLMHRETKTAFYPKRGEADTVNQDLNIVTMLPLRNKHGLSGFTIDIIVSQKEGVLPHLTQFHFIKEYDYFGLNGSKVSYELDLLPDVKFQRTTVRSKIDEDENFYVNIVEDGTTRQIGTVGKLKRALELTSDLAQIKIFHPVWENMGFMCTPAELYKDIKDLGYDWDELLSTRGKETIDNLTNPIKYLSIIDLLKMRKGEYTPYWKQ